MCWNCSEYFLFRVFLVAYDLIWFQDWGLKWIPQYLKKIQISGQILFPKIEWLFVCKHDLKNFSFTYWWSVLKTLVLSTYWWSILRTLVLSTYWWSILVLEVSLLSECSSRNSRQFRRSSVSPKGVVVWHFRVQKLWFRKGIWPPLICCFRCLCSWSLSATFCDHFLKIASNLLIIRLVVQRSRVHGTNYSGRGVQDHWKLRTVEDPEDFPFKVLNIKIAQIVRQQSGAGDKRDKVTACSRLHWEANSTIREEPSVHSMDTWTQWHYAKWDHRWASQEEGNDQTSRIGTLPETIPEQI